MKIMKKRTILAVSFVLGQGVSTASAAPGNASGPAALALAGVVASHSSVLASFDRRAMARLFGGNSGISSGGAFLMPHRSIIRAPSFAVRRRPIRCSSRKRLI
jgi:hypothetical protein